MKSVTVMSTGNELLYGSTQDTNGSLISGRLYPLQVRVRMLLAVGDDIEDLENAFRRALECTDMIIVTGGLGPTDDDNTIEALRRIFGFSVAVDVESKEKMSGFFSSMGMPLSGADLKMVEVPASARIIPNMRGLAPGFILRNENKIIISLPGVPVEMAEMMDNAVIPFLKEECGIMPRESVFIRIIGMRESEINDIVKSMGLDLGGIEWGITAKRGITTVSFTQKPEAPFNAAAIIGSAELRFGARLLARPFETPEEEVIQLLRVRGMTIAAAESCTGGLISKRLTDIPGSSDVFTGGVIAYSNAVKVGFLGVSEDALSRFGAVS
jgi:nicotinamide-nucleotide amidase